MESIKIKDMEFFKRLKNESPDFFKKVQKIGVVLSSIGGILLLLPGTAIIATGLITAGSAMALVGKLPVTDPEKLKEEIEKIKNQSKP